MTSALQNQAAQTTIYCRNLEERIKIPELISSLTEIFSEYGSVIDVVAKKNLRAKGQAFVTFDSHEAAAKAVEEVNGFELFGKEMQIDYARTRSDAEVKMQEGDAGLQAHKEARIAEREKKQAKLEQSEKKRPLEAGSTGLSSRPAKTIKGTGLKATGTNSAAIIPDEYLPPNKILFVRDIPDSYDADSLGRIFGRFDGFRDLRTVPGRKGIAFVEYADESSASSAREATAGMLLGDESTPIRVTYQRA